MYCKVLQIRDLLKYEEILQDEDEDRYNPLYVFLT